MRTSFGPDEEDAFIATRNALVDAYASVLGETHDVPDTFVASIMLDYKWGYRDGDIGTWQRVDLEDLLLGHFPRKVTLDDEDLLRVVPDLTAFLAFLDGRGLLRGAPLSELEVAARALVPAFVEAMHDPARYGMAKGLFDSMRADGVDLDDESDVERWIEDFNAQPFEERGDIFPDLEPEPEAYPPVKLAPLDDLERAARESTPVARLAAFADFLGQGRKLTQKGYLTVADGRVLVETLETGDRVDEAVGDRVFATRSTAELPELDLLFRWARASGFVKVQHGRVSATRRGRSMGSAPLDDWAAAFDGLIKVLSVSPRSDRTYGLGWDEAVGWLAERLPLWLYGQPGLGLDVLQTTVWEATALQYEISLEPAIRDAHERIVSDAVDRLVGRLVGLGAVETADETICLTPLGTWATNRMLRARGETATVVGELVQTSASELVAATAEMPLDIAEGEIRTWIEARPGTAVHELGEAARSGALPLMALHALSLAGPDAETEVRALLSVDELRPQAQMWLVGNGFDDAASLSPETMRSLLVETLAVQVDADGPVAAVAHFQGLGPDEEQIAMLEDLLRADHPRTSEVLQVIGRYHPVKPVAKAARKTAFKRQPIDSRGD